MFDTGIDERTEVDSTIASGQISQELKRDILTDALLTKFLENSPGGVLMVGADARILQCNRRFLELFVVARQTGTMSPHWDRAKAK